MNKLSQAMRTHPDIDLLNPPFWPSIVILHLVLNSKLHREDTRKPTFLIGTGSLNENEAYVKKGKRLLPKFQELKNA